MGFADLVRCLVPVHDGGKPKRRAPQRERGVLGGTGLGHLRALGVRSEAHLRGRKDKPNLWRPIRL